MSSFGFDKTPPAGSVAVSEWKSQRGYFILQIKEIETNP